MEDSLGHLFSGRVSGLPKWQRFDAATPTRDGCDLPYSLSDCCTRSHMNVLQNFSRDEAVRDDQWVLILEDDVALHESIAPHRLGQIINAGLIQARIRGAEVAGGPRARLLGFHAGQAAHHRP